MLYGEHASDICQLRAVIKNVTSREEWVCDDLRALKFLLSYGSVEKCAELIREAVALEDEHADVYELARRAIPDAEQVSPALARGGGNHKSINTFPTFPLPPPSASPELDELRTLHDELEKTYYTASSLELPLDFLYVAGRDCEFNWEALLEECLT